MSLLRHGVAYLTKSHEIITWGISILEIVHLTNTGLFLIMNINERI